MDKKLKVTDRGKVKNLTHLFALTYMISYITRINYGAVIAEMECNTGMPRTMLSMALTGSFVTYGIGQIISGICGDRFSPKKLLAYGLFVSAGMNLLIPLCWNPWQMAVIWCLNGFAQSFMWPPVVKLMTTFFSDEDYRKSSVEVSRGSSYGTIFVYLLSPILILVSGWRLVFFVASIAGLIMFFVWNRYCPDVEKNIDTVSEKLRTRNSSCLFTPLMFGIMIAIILQGMLRDGVTTWMPSFISETYQMSSVISILSGVVLPIFGILCLQTTSFIYRKILKNPITCASFFFGLGVCAAGGILLVFGKNAMLSVFFSAILTGTMHGVNLILIAMLPAYFQKYGNVSTVSGILNSCTYIGSALSTYGIASFSEAFGWKRTINLWLLIALTGMLICLICIRPWKKQHEN